MGEKDDAIQEINNTKQTVNELSKGFRDQIDFKVLKSPAVIKDKKITALILKARDCLTSADRETKRILEEAKRELVKPTTISKLEFAVRYENLGKVIGPYFLKGLPINHGEVTNEEVEKFAEKITEEQHGNYLRFLVGLGYYELITRLLLQNFFHHDNLIYRTATKDVNQRWLDMFRKRVGMFVDREWHVQLDFLNECTMHEYETSHYAIHPVNEKNNTGFFVPELQTIYPTHFEPDSWRGHFREWDQVYKKWSEAPYNYRSEDEMTSAHRDDMNRNRATREMFEWYIRYMVDLCLSEWGDKVSFGTNEWASRTGFHFYLGALLKRHGVKTTPVASYYYADWYKSGGQIWGDFIGSWHGVYYHDKAYIFRDEYTLDQIREQFLPEGKQFIFSGDGCKWGKYGKDLKKLKATVEYCCKYGHGFELNNDFNKRLGDIDYVNLLE